jgi:hydrogenase/urease accessory protein HupE
MKWQASIVVAAVALACSIHVSAHGLAGAFVSIETSDDHRAEVLLKHPNVEGRSTYLTVRFADGCEEVGEPVRAQRSDGVVERWVIECDAPLTGMEIEISGLDARVGEAFIELRSPGVREWNTIVRRGSASTRLGGGGTKGVVGSASYFPLGVDHILSGFDHLLFLLALLLIVVRTRAEAGWRAVAKTILATVTAFTVGHSVTLAAATLDLVRLPLAPTELVIALSVLLLAVELARDDRQTWTMRFPWVVAFAFGLLHGFGFAGALADIGLPPDGIAVPLLLFNLGVETGQVVVVLFAMAAMVAFGWIAAKRPASRQRSSFLDTAMIYGIGTLTAYWCLERSLGWLL